MRDSALDSRSKIVKLVSLYPGIHLRELQRAVGVSFNSIRYNTEKLSRSGEIICEKTKGYSRLYPLGTSDQDKVIYSLIQNKTTRRIIEELTKEPLFTNKELTEKTGFAKSTVSEHIHQLLSANLVRLTLSDQGNFKVELQDREHIESLLGRARQFSLDNDVVGNFADLWDF